MLFKAETLEGIREGRVTLAFRRWRRAGVRPGSRLRTAVGVIGIDAVTAITDSEVTAGQIERSGHRSPEAFWRELTRHPDGTLYRIELSYVGADPRVALREQGDLDATELDSVRAELVRIDGAARRGPWTGDVLRVIRESPGAPAGELADRLGREKLAFKRDVRKLKELGLTESLGTGYRLSPRGEVVLGTLDGGA
ncbi:hypothetical protein [Streptomyces uncialis]|uniref:hypothetical protein n=1 Tax=Streptomyces uncialis TaxID=1048205 RepID=UPI0034014FDF